MRSIVSILVICCASMLAAQQPAVSKAPDPTASVPSPTARETTHRHHFVARDQKNNVYFEFTEIESVINARQEVIILLWDNGTARGIRFRRVWDEESKVSTYGVEEVGGGSFLRLEFGIAAREFVDQARQNAELWQSEEAQLTFTTNSVRRTILESQWDEEFNARSWRTELRSSLAPGFLESLERLRNGLLQQPSRLVGFRDILLHFLYYGEAEQSRAPKLLITSAPPDCRFDADMGHACSDAQLKRIRVAAEAGKPLSVY